MKGVCFHDSRWRSRKANLQTDVSPKNDFKGLIEHIFGISCFKEFTHFILRNSVVQLKGHVINCSNAVVNWLVSWKPITCVALLERLGFSI